MFPEELEEDFLLDELLEDFLVEELLEDFLLEELVEDSAAGASVATGASVSTGAAVEDAPEVLLVLLEASLVHAANDKHIAIAIINANTLFISFLLLVNLV